MGLGKVDEQLQRLACDDAGLVGFAFSALRNWILFAVKLGYAFMYMQTLRERTELLQDPALISAHSTMPQPIVMSIAAGTDALEQG